MKQFLSVVLLAFSLCSLANIPEHETDFFSGPYLSLGPSMLIHSSKIKSRATSDGFVFFKASDTGNSFGLNAEFGMRRVIKRFLADGDISLRYFPGTSSGMQISGINTPRVYAPINLGFELKPGVLLTSRTALFAIIGVETAHFKVGYIFNSVNTQLKGWQVGPSIGAGVNIAILTRLLLQMRYLYIYYNDLNYNDSSNAARVTFKPRMNIVELNLSYRFK